MKGVEDFLVSKLRVLYENDDGYIDDSFVLETKPEAMVDEVVSVELYQRLQGCRSNLNGRNLFAIAFLKDERGNTYFSLSFFPNVQTSLHLSHEYAFSAEDFLGYINETNEIKGKYIRIKDDQIKGWETYTGVERMAYIWSMIPIPGSRFGLRYSHKDVIKPMVIEIMIGECFKNQGDIIFKKLQTTISKRYYMREEFVSRSVIETVNGVRGTLFTPKNQTLKQYPGVIDLFGTAGGILEFRAALLASHGITCLALPYFSYKDLPESFYGLNLEYFETAIDWFSSLPEVDSTKGIGVCGVSYGGELCLQLGSYFPKKVTAIVAISTSDINTNIDITYKGKQIPFAFPNYHKLEKQKFEDKRNEFLLSIDKTRIHSVVDALSVSNDLISDNPSKNTLDARIKVENMEASLMLLSGGNDANWPASKFSQQIMNRLDTHKYSYPFQHILYDKTGHLIEPPFTPFCSMSYHKLMNGSILWGGEGKQHNIAQEHSWDMIISFFKQHLASTSKL